MEEETEMIVTDQNSVPMFINLVELKVENITKVESNEDETEVTYKDGSVVTYYLDDDGHKNFIDYIQARYSKLIEVGIINDPTKTGRVNGPTITGATTVSERAIKIE